VADDVDPAATAVSRREFASVALSESAVRVVSVAAGVRRALSAENRNRIRFEIRREVRRSRKQRRLDLKEARRQLRAEQATQATGREQRPGSGLAEDAA
jgi:hypothetical protein